jgi:hypothetical protein
MNAIVTTGSNAMTPTSMESAIQLAEMMARGKLVPAHLHNSPGDCLMVVEQALRWAMSPFAVAQCTSVIQGKLMFEGKLVAAALNASGILSARLDYVFAGAGNDRAVTVRGTLKGETKAREVTVYLAEAKTSNGMWIKQPDQQLVYAGTRVWARRHAPEVMLGVYAPEEFDQAAPFAGTTLDAEPEPAPVRAAAAAMAKEARVAKLAKVYDAPAREPPAKSPPGERTEMQWQSWIERLRNAAAVCTSRDMVAEIGGRPSVKDALENAPNWVRRDINDLLTDAYARLPEADVVAELEAEGAKDWPGPDPEKAQA